jgi:hypothetical protein
MARVPFSVMAGHSRPKDGVASARLCPAIHLLCSTRRESVDARIKSGHDERVGWAEARCAVPTNLFFTKLDDPMIDTI